MAQTFSNIPTNIITGFLGVGKTTLIRELLKNKPANERWAVLVNEFGEVGIDGSLFAADDIAVKEVPGGCMCCAVGVPSKVALNQLIRTQKPDRILIEPTGLAHPKQVLDLFSGADYQGVLDIRALVCLVDPWSLSQAKFLELPAFIDQISLADVLLATKKDSASDEHLNGFFEYAKGLSPQKTRVDAIAGGQMPWQWLDEVRIQPMAESPEGAHQQGGLHQHHAKPAIPVEASVEPLQEVLRVENEADFGFSCGWRFPAGTRFDSAAVLSILSNLAVPRVKGVLLTDDGWWVVNKMRETVSSEILAEAKESKIEMIAIEKPDWQEVDRCLLDCIQRDDKTK